jgi:Rrf2 family protein
MIRTKAAAYALLAMYEIGKRSQKNPKGAEGVQAGEIADKYKLPIAYASKIMSQLARVGILRSDRGPRGGFRLNRPADKINLFDVFTGVGGLLPEPGGAPAVYGLPAQVQNTLNKAHNELAKKTQDTLRKLVLSDIVSG